MKKRLLVLTAAFLCALNAMSQQGSRLIGEGFRVYMGGVFDPVDTATSTYTPGAFNPLEDMWIPSQTVRGAYNMGNYYFTSRTTNTFNGQQQLSEKLEEQYDTAAAIWKPAVKDLYHYNANGYVDTLIGQVDSSGSFKTQTKFIYTYDGANRLIDQLLLFNAGQGLLNFSRDVIHYNSSGQKDTSTTYLWNNNTMTWNPYLRTTYYYNTPNPIAEVKANYPGAWAEFDSLINTLDANANILTQLHKVLQGGTWVANSNSIFTYDASNNQLTSILQLLVGGVLTNRLLTTNTYNTSNQPTLTTVQSWDAATSMFTWQDNNRLQAFSYETVVTGVKGPLVQNDAMRIYPIPANNLLTLDLKGTDMKHATVILFDMAGKLAGHWNASTATQQIQTLDISGIPAGTYLLKVVGDNGVLNQKINIVR